ncbi:MAG TPA: FKBP-type peptidyl-prolyl cis-trans isomerase [Thermoanaerobaculia bacterium]|jgi:FKBP-type peptidyl-prolyl cis-trans isomerase|nr:FKBP-type peptidyl-prolyl cis-trans isomerase [Thermoanaerobaculia bacterium]
MIQKTVPCALFAALLAAGSLSALPGQITKLRQTEPTPAPTPTPQEVVTPSGLRYRDLQVGEGAEAAKGNIVEVHYTGWLEDNTKFDASQDPSHPFTFRIGIDDVIQGWHQGITGMKVGGKRRLVVPPELGYGKQGMGRVVPPNATLVFEVELVGVR